MEEILHLLIWRLSNLLVGFYTSQVVQDFFHQQYVDGTTAVINKQLVAFKPISGSGEYYLAVYL